MPPISAAGGQQTCTAASATPLGKLLLRCPSPESLHLLCAGLHCTAQTVNSSEGSDKSNNALRGLGSSKQQVSTAPVPGHGCCL